MKNPRPPIYVTQPFLPPLEEVLPYIEDIWQRKVLTNNGYYHRELEKALCDYLGVKYISLFANGTLALVVALQALHVKGEVITTPFSFVATTHALWWNHIKPVFVDIEPHTFNLDPGKIEAAITPQTTAILPVHVFGNPCGVKEIELIARRHGLKVIYDACHAFGVTLDNQSVLNFGDLSVMSFHATKVFTTFEGGAIVCHDQEMKARIDQLKNFGITSETTVSIPGINAKMNEFQAALGIVQLRHVDRAIEKRKEIVAYYRDRLRDVRGITVAEDVPNVKPCHTYFPVLIDEQQFGKSRDEVYNALKEQDIHPRRLFYPLISQFPAYRGLESAEAGKMPVAETITKRVLCLPLYPSLGLDTVDLVLEVLLANQS